MSLQHLNVAQTGLVALVAAGMLVSVRRLSRFVGEVPSGLPGLGLPNVSWGDVPLVLFVSASCFIVILAQKAATSRASALRYCAASVGMSERGLKNKLLFHTQEKEHEQQRTTQI